MSNLSAFLKPAYLREEKEIVISKRFVDENGEPVPFKIRSISQEENEQITKASRRQRKVSGTVQEYLDTIEYGRRMVVTGTVFPDFRDKQLCEAYGTLDPMQVPSKMLQAGEFAALMTAYPSFPVLTPTHPRTRQKTDGGGRPRDDGSLLLLRQSRLASQ